MVHMAKIQDCTIVQNKKFNDAYYVMSLENEYISARALPGQFVQVSCGENDPLLRRPFAVYQVNNRSFSFLYKVVGRGTQALSSLKNGDTLSVLGPLGNSFSTDKAGDVILIAGGVGIGPIRYLASYLQAKHKAFTLIYGGKNSDHIVDFDGIANEYAKYMVVTEDGSVGKKGLVTEAMALLSMDSNTIIQACGPEAMLKSVVSIAKKKDVSSEVSLEARMACGFGVCLGCVVETSAGDYQKVCDDGPVFDGRRFW